MPETRATYISERTIWGKVASIHLSISWSFPPLFLSLSLILLYLTLNLRYPFPALAYHFLLLLLKTFLILNREWRKQNTRRGRLNVIILNNFTTGILTVHADDKSNTRTQAVVGMDSNRWLLRSNPACKRFPGAAAMACRPVRTLAAR